MMEISGDHFDVVTVTLNPAIDWTLTIPDFTAGRVNRVEKERSHPGGKGINVAAALVDYGRRVAATGFLGGENAADFEEFFGRKGIEDRFMRIAGETRTGIKINDPLRGVTTDINFPGAAPGADDTETLMRRLGELDADYFVLGGSMPPGVDAGTYETMTRMLIQRERRVVIDTSGEALRRAIDAQPRIVKPNIHELEELVGKSLSGRKAIVAAAQDLNARGIALVVVSLGADGSIFVTADSAIEARPPAVESGSTVGAGDAMVAGIVAAQLDGLALEGCARLATAFSMQALMRGKPGLNSRQETEALALQVITENVTHRI